MKAFRFAGTPSIRFGIGTAARLADALPADARRVLFVTGSFQRTNKPLWATIEASLADRRITYETARVHSEPTVQWVDETVETFRAHRPDAVIAIGGGSAMDAGKAVSAMLRADPGVSVLQYLEGQPSYRPHSGDKTFFVAVPTTSGTGSEMTKNAVLGIPGDFKRSLRHDRFIPDAAIVDASAALTCPTPVKAASGLDALTQLIESYVSTSSSPLTDALALSGIEAVAGSLLPICTHAGDDERLHERMAYAAMISGITLAHAGLGLVHGFASPLGGMFPIPHGVICGTLLAEVTKRNIDELAANGSATAAEGLAKYAKVGSVLTGCEASDAVSCLDRLTALLEEWTERLHMPRLGPYGVSADRLDPIVAAADNKQSPARLDRTAMRDMLLARL